MSCDYGIWYSETSISNREATEIYIALCEKWPFLEGENQAVRAFYEELITHWPEIDTIPEEKLDDKEYCPWSCEICHSGMAVVTACVWPMGDKVGSFIKVLAAKHRLIFFDPQSERVYLPQHIETSSLKHGGWLKRLFGSFV